MHDDHEHDRSDIAVIRADQRAMKEDIGEIKQMLRESFVTRASFAPVKLIVYGQTGAILLAVVGSLLALILRK